MWPKPHQSEVYSLPPQWLAREFACDQSEASQRPSSNSSLPTEQSPDCLFQLKDDRLEIGGSLRQDTSLVRIALQQEWIKTSRDKQMRGKGRESLRAKHPCHFRHFDYEPTNSPFVFKLICVEFCLKQPKEPWQIIFVGIDYLHE